MAVRRISDLPELKSNYPDAVLSSCLIEVSYTPRNAVYQSFYTKLDYVLESISRNLPRATKSQFGIVKIGNNINVEESGANMGYISVPTATASTAGVNVRPPANIPFLGTDKDGKWERHDIPEPTIIQATDGNILHVSYPIGSLYITASSSHPYPPGYRETRSDGTVKGSALKDSNDQIVAYMHWKKIPNDRSLWTSASLGTTGSPLEISPLLPKLPTFTCDSAGDHQHAIAASTRGGITSVEGSGHHADKTVSTGSSTSLGDPTNEDNWPLNAQTGYKQYNAFLTEGITKDKMLTLAWITPSKIPDINYKYGVFESANTLQTYIDEHPTDPFSTAVINITTANGWSQTKAGRFKTINNIDQYFKYQYRTIPLSRLKMEKTGAHTHTVSAATSASNIYNNSNNDTVRPNSIAVAIWQRIDNLLPDS